MELAVFAKWVSLLDLIAQTQLAKLVHLTLARPSLADIELFYALQVGVLACALEDALSGPVGAAGDLMTWGVTELSALVFTLIGYDPLVVESPAVWTGNVLGGALSLEATLDLLDETSFLLVSSRGSQPQWGASGLTQGTDTDRLAFNASSVQGDVSVFLNDVWADWRVLKLEREV